MKKTILSILPLILFGLLCLFFWKGLALDPHKLPSERIGQSLPQFKLPSVLDGQPSFDQAALQGQVALINVWASWCATCTEEQAFLMSLANQGIPIFGINYKDDVNDAREWLATWGNPYRLVGADEDGKLAIDLGVYGTPETFLIDKQGIIRYRHAGTLDKEVWERDFLPRIKELKGA